jgi:hypothetical protein
LSYSQRSEGLIGNLGWDTVNETLLANAKALLAACRYTTDQVFDLKATYSDSGGSRFDFKSSSLAMLQRLRRDVRAARLVYRTDPDAKPAWVDCKKNTGEMRQSRLVRGAAQYLRDLEAQCARDHDDAAVATVEADFRGKFVGIQHVGRMCGSVAGMWRWFTAATLRYGAEVCDVGRDWINDG